MNKQPLSVECNREKARKNPEYDGLAWVECFCDKCEQVNTRQKPLSEEWKKEYSKIMLEWIESQWKIEQAYQEGKPYTRMGFEAESAKVEKKLQDFISHLLSEARAKEWDNLPPVLYGEGKHKDEEFRLTLMKWEDGWSIDYMNDNQRTLKMTKNRTGTLTECLENMLKFVNGLKSK